MPTLIKPFIRNLENVKRQIPQIAQQAVKDNAEDIVNIVKLSQLGVGLNSDGLPLKWSGGDGFYADATQEIANNDPGYSRQEPKNSGSPYNFNWSGNTFAFMGLKIKGEDEFEIFTTGGKQSLLEGIYGEIFDLTEEHNKFVNETIILPALQKFILDNLLTV